jgi:hypothetical protein
MTLTIKAKRSISAADRQQNVHTACDCGRACVRATAAAAVGVSVNGWPLRCTRGDGRYHRDQSPLQHSTARRRMQATQCNAARSSVQCRVSCTAHLDELAKLDPVVRVAVDEGKHGLPHRGLGLLHYLVEVDVHADEALVVDVVQLEAGPKLEESV